MSLLILKLFTTSTELGLSVVKLFPLEGAKYLKYLTIAVVLTRLYPGTRLPRGCGKDLACRGYNKYKLNEFKKTIETTSFRLVKLVCLFQA